jgi:hypothetical protein
MTDPTIDLTGILAQMECAEAQRQREQQDTFRAELAASAPMPEPPASTSSSVQYPPGFVGYLAQYIHAQAIRPVPEVAVVTALGIMAGLAGQRWLTSTNSGLNLFVVLVARSATGKDAMNTGIGAVMNAMEPKYPAARSLFDFTEYASGPALTKALAMSPSMLNVAGEIGHRFLAMSKGKESALATWRKTLTDLYHKSGPNGVFGGIGYSDQDKNVGSMSSVAFSLIGETTPTNFYESITEEMMGDGFMSRFLVIQYEGDRPAKNRHPFVAPPQNLVNWLLNIACQAKNLNERSVFQPVSETYEAAAFLDTFDLECDQHIIAAGDDDRIRQLWSRAHFKALRVSSLLAVGDNPYQPVVQLAHVEWAIALVRHGNAAFLNRIRTGEVGAGTDAGREQKILDLCREFVLLPTERLPAYLKDGVNMQAANIVPRKYLQQRTQRLAAFDKHAFGHARALDLAISAACTNGNLMEIKGTKVVENFGFHGRAFRLLHAE